MKHNADFLISRRKALISLASAASVLPIVALTGCGSSASETGSQSSIDTDTATGTGNPGNDSSTAVDNGNWASGGTNSMTDNFPDDSLFDSSSSCEVQQHTEGPCYFDGDYANYLFNLEQSADGSLLAYKRIIIS